MDPQQSLDQFATNAPAMVVVMLTTVVRRLSSTSLEMDGVVSTVPGTDTHNNEGLVLCILVRTACFWTTNAMQMFVRVPYWIHACNSTCHFSSCNLVWY